MIKQEARNQEKSAHGFPASEFPSSAFLRVSWFPAQTLFSVLKLSPFKSSGPVINPEFHDEASFILLRKFPPTGLGREPDDDEPEKVNQCDDTAGLAVVAVELSHQHPHLQRTDRRENSPRVEGQA